MFAFAALVLSGCLTILPQWQRTVEIQHSDVTELNDKNPIIAQSGQNRFILFIGDTQSGDKELFLQRMNAAGQLVGGATKLTNNTGEDDQPQLAEQDGWLYVVWRYKQTPSDPYTIWWARVNTTTLSYASGPTLVTTLPGDSYTPQLAVRSNGTSVVVWRQVDNNLGTIYYRQVNSNGTFGGAEVIVSQGPGCASASYDQRNPRVTRSYSGGGFAQVAWIGQNSGGDSVYWREMDNTSNAPSTDCIVLSGGVTYAGPEIDLDLAINPGTNRSYVAWTHQNQPGNDEDVYFRSVSFLFPGQPCDILNVSNAVTTTSEGGVRIAAGHAISNWVHLVWERYNQTPGQGSIRYALIQDGANCANAGQKTPTKITPSGNLSLSGLPVPPTADVDSPKIAVATNAVIARLSDGSSTMMMSAQGAQFDEAALLAQMSSEEASADSSDAAVTPAFNEGPAPATASLDTLHATEARNETPPQPAPDCAAIPDHPRCVEQAGLPETAGMMGMAAQSASAAAASSFQCGSNAADAVVVSFYDDTNRQMYAALFQAGEVLNGNSCVRVVSAQYPNDGGLKLEKLTRLDYSSPCCTDYNDHYPFISKRGLPTVAWRGREPSVFIAAANDEIYVAEGRFSAYAPIVQRP